MKHKVIYTQIEHSYSNLQDKSNVYFQSSICAVISMHRFVIDLAFWATRLPMLRPFDVFLLQQGVCICAPCT